MGARFLVFACLIALAATGCGTGERGDDAAAVTARFHAALEAGDGQAACQELSEDTASKLEQQEKKPCEKAILGLELPKGGSVAVQRVQMLSAYTSLAEGSTDFLNEGPEGWKISSAGCKPTAPGRPYDCELEG
ncbi:MAG TPA: hypothetical protein VGO83_04525 [Thermoleophilaceae bacterium]|jgi:hypothetical protein|nr:hypothetical protein [Thermoleophilaceae bacterium]